MGAVQCCRGDIRESETALEATEEAFNGVAPVDAPYGGAQPAVVIEIAGAKAHPWDTAVPEEAELHFKKEGTDAAPRRGLTEQEPDPEEPSRSCEEAAGTQPTTETSGFAANLARRLSSTATGLAVLQAAGFAAIQVKPEVVQDNMAKADGPAVGRAYPECSQNEISKYEPADGLDYCQEKSTKELRSTDRKHEDKAKDARGRNEKHNSKAKTAPKNSAKSAAKKHVGEVKKKAPGDDAKKKGSEGERKRPVGHKIDKNGDCGSACDGQAVPAVCKSGTVDLGQKDAIAMSTEKGSAESLIGKGGSNDVMEKELMDLKSTDIQLRISACQAMGSLGPLALPAAGSLADTAIHDDNEKVRVAARGALSTLRAAAGEAPEEGIKKAKDALRAEDVAHALSAYHLLSSLGAGKENEEEAAERATGGLKAQDANVRRRSCRLLSKLGDVAHVGKVAESAVVDTHDEIRREAVSALKSICDRGVPFPEDTMKQLFQEATLKNFQATMNVHSVLADTGHADPYAAEFAKLAAECLDDKERDTRKDACSALGRLGDSAKPHVDALIERASKDKVSDVRSAALTSLGDLGSLLNADVIKAIVDRAQTDVNTSVQSSAIQALGKLQSDGIKLPDKATRLVEEFQRKEKEEEAKRLAEKKKREKEVKLMLAEAGMHLCNYAEKGKTKKIKELIQFGADPDAANSQGLVALKVACEHQKVKAVQALVDAKADVNLQSVGVTTVTGAIYTALHLAARTGNEEIAKIIIAAGADPLVRNSRQQLPSEIAEAKKHGGLARILHKVQDEARARQVAK